MAHRQLCAAAFVVLGLVAVGCGKGSSNSDGETPMTNDSAPPSADDVPANAEDTPNSADDTPSSADDAPPSSEDTPVGGGGGRLQQLCESACEVLAAIGECEGSDLDPMGQEVCDNGACAVAVEPTEPIPCLGEIEGLFGCIANLPDVCMPTEQQAAQCQDDVEAFSECAEKQEPVDEPNPAPMCTPADDCQCPTLCATCLCANTGPDAQQCTQLCPT